MNRNIKTAADLQLLDILLCPIFFSDGLKNYKVCPKSLGTPLYIWDINIIPRPNLFIVLSCFVWWFKLPFPFLKSFKGGERETKIV